jgi:uncharacterized cysteine cluster protein YcgN (CxxCxxCC family)
VIVKNERYCDRCMMCCMVRMKQTKRKGIGRTRDWAKG